MTLTRAISNTANLMGPHGPLGPDGGGLLTGLLFLSIIYLTIWLRS